MWVGIKTSKNKSARPFRLLDLSILDFSIIREGGDASFVPVSYHLSLAYADQKRHDSWREVMGENRPQSQQSLSELGLRLRH